MDRKDKEMFARAVREIVGTIPFGHATSYAAIAKSIGHPNMSRMVGRVMSNLEDAGIPAHRVVNSQGILSGRAAFGDSNQMQKLLEKEGITVVNNRIKNWKVVFWDPLQEIKL